MFAVKMYLPVKDEIKLKWKKVCIRQITQNIGFYQGSHQLVHSNQAVGMLFLGIFLVCLELCLKVSSLYLESLLVSLLGSGDCTIVLLGLESLFVQNVAENMQVTDTPSKPMLVFDDSALADTSKLNTMSKCFIGISNIKAINTLQHVLFSTSNRQLIGIVPSNINGQSFVANATLNKKHHPIMLLKENGDGVQQSLLCHENVIDLNMLIRSEWIKKLIFDSLTFERLCNNGNHPLKHKALVVSSYALPPYLYMDKQLNINGGVTFSIVNAISGHYGFEVTHVPANNWFTFYANGSIGGSLAPVLFGQADLSIEQSMQNVYTLGSMTTTTYTAVMTFVERAPLPISQLWNLTYSLDVPSWMLLLGSCFLVAMLLCLISKFEESFLTNMVDKSKTTNFLNACEISVALLLQEFKIERSSFRNTSLNTAVRFMWVLTTMFILMGFSGNLKSSFIRQNYEDRTMTLSEMVDKDMVIHTATEVIKYLEMTKSVSEINNRLLCQAHKKDSVFVTGPDAMDFLLNEIINNGGAFMINQHTLEYSRGLYLFTGTDFPLVIIPERYSPFPMGMLFQKFDPRVNYFDVVISQITDTGIIDGYFRKALPYSKLIYLEKAEERPLILEHFMISMIICLVGLFLGGLLFTTEMGENMQIKESLQICIDD